jgi:dihydrofolate reductase
VPIFISVAVAKNGVMGKTGAMLPWRLPADLAYFRKITLGNPVVMGRKTFDSIGRALPKRRNVVISRNTSFVAPGCEVVDSLNDALRLVNANDNEIFIIGGASIIEQCLGLAERLYLTEVDAEPEGDITLNLDLAGWREISREDYPADDRNEHAFAHRVLVKTKPDLSS